MIYPELFISFKRVIKIGILVAGICSFNQKVCAQSESSIWNLKMKEVIKSTATKQPLVTGGSLTTSAAIFGTSMVIMAFEVSAKKERGNSKKKYLDSLIKNLRSSVDTLMHFADQDIKVFNRFLASMKLPRNTEAEKRHRDSIYYEALKEATVLPVNIAKSINQVLWATQAGSSICSSQIISDLGLGSLILKSSLNGILLIAQGNIQLLKKDDKYFFDKERKMLLMESETSERKIKEAVKTSMKIQEY
jgi:formiminotetrahydrofolate cyclodeaminase